MTAKRRVLFFAEAATLAHVVRPIVLAGALDSHQYDVSVATGTDFRHHVEAAGLSARELWCIGTRAYLAAVAAGRPVFPYSVLERYVADDLRLIEAVQPDLVVGDFRLSLAVSARLAGKPYLGISNAYWSPYAPARFEVPVHAATRLLGVAFSNAVFGLLRPLILARHSLPMHRLRRKHGLPSIGFDLRRVFTDADLTLFADVPELVPTSGPALDTRYRYIGPITWSPPAAIPEALAGGTDRRPLVYVSMGSSGDAAALGVIVDAVVACGCRAAVAATAGPWSQSHGDSVVVRDMLPGGQMAATAALVICNGGSPGVHQALQQGTPVIGIPANLDQLLNMQFAVRSGAALSLRADQLSAVALGRLIHHMLSVETFRERAQTVRAWFAHYRAEARFGAIVSGVLRDRPSVEVPAVR